MSTGESQLLAGRYRVVEQLGRGGMGVVWRAHDEVLGREVAVKELRTFTDASAPELGDLRLRMQREARAAARVRHPSVVAVHDVTEHEGRPVIVMELIDGPSLDDVLAERGALEPGEAAAIGATVLEALAAAHQAGVLHRDVKPGNILLDRSGRVVLTDFGIAAMDDPGDGSATHLTRSGELVGSLDYLAPERAQGQEPGPASDVWALGATLYAAVEGAAPFRRTSTWSTLNAIVVEPLPEARRAGALGPVLLRLMDKDPARRPDARTAAGLLAEVAAGAALTAPTAIHPAPAPAAPQRSATVRDALPHRPEGFGPVVAPVPRPHPAETFGPVVAQAPPERAAGRKGRGRVLVAAGAAAVVLVGGGVAYALLDHGAGDGGGQQAVGAANGTSPRPADDQGEAARQGTSAPSAGATPNSPSSAPRSSGKPSAKADPAKSGDAKGDAGKAPDPKKNPPSSPGGGGAAPPAGSCRPIAGGRFNCEVWRAANSIRSDGAAAGVLNAGTNYFYCQKDLGRRETYGKWTNTWWARTDDDSGNTQVYVSVVYLKGGDNDQPVPGLKAC
ncbi:serine/threonine protein kinase [Streptomyces sp. SDr-06]|uniref:serine/threonine-protein kinase n=1 Tax=Streptomyces sp. SDr-06 TaxID=2267702 RepID=UPI000DE81B91|nr:serine/threonine-protein kinase [Streptomyces sp. SDr-06]RCH70551.1 serine/threonine protein kinase [Streptomyces sp. SDr-06]